MMMDALGLNRRCNCLSLFGGKGGRGISKLLCFAIESGSGFLRILMLEFFVLHTSHLVAMLLWQNLAILDGLHRGVVMILLNLTVYSSGDVFMTSRDDLLVLDGRCLSFINGGIVLAMSSYDSCYRCFRFVHV